METEKILWMVDFENYSAVFTTREKAKEYVANVCKYYSYNLEWKEDAEDNSVFEADVWAENLMEEYYIDKIELDPTSY